MQELQPRTLQDDVPFEPAAVFAVTPERMLPGGELHPDLMGPPGVEGDVRKAQGPIVAVMRYSSTASRTPLRGRLTGKTLPFRLSLKR